MPKYSRYPRKRYSTPIPFEVMIVGVIAASLFLAVSSNQISKYWLYMGVLVLGIFIALIVGIVFFIWKKNRERTRLLGFVDIDQMSGIDFEQYVGELLRFQGYKTTFTPVMGDFGTDIVAEKNGEKTSVQIKRYKSWVGIDAINQAVAGKALYKCQKSMVVTNSYFTQAAQKQAHANNCVLVDRNTLQEWIIAFQGQKEQHNHD